MKQTKDIYFVVAWIVSLVIGIVFCATIIGAILGAPLIIASTKFNKARTMNDEELIANRSSLFGWGIFLAIVLAPSILGLIVVLIFVFMVNNYILNLEKGNTEETEKSFGQKVKEGTSSAWDGFKDTFGIKPKLQKEKERLQELDKMKEEGVITEEEYQAKRKQILGL